MGKTCRRRTADVLPIALGCREINAKVGFGSHGPTMQQWVRHRLSDMSKILSPENGQLAIGEVVSRQRSRLFSGVFASRPIAVPRVARNGEPLFAPHSRAKFPPYTKPRRLSTRGSRRCRPIPASKLANHDPAAQITPPQTASLAPCE